MHTFKFIPIPSLLALVLLAVAAPAHAACGANGDEFELTFIERARWPYGSACDPYAFDSYPVLYQFPLASAGPSCTAQVEPASCEITDNMTCEDGGVYIGVMYNHVELVDGGEGDLIQSVEDEWGGFLCYIEYDVEVTQLN